MSLWLVGVISRRWVESMGVVTMCSVGVVVNRFPHNITYPYSTCISFFGSSIPTFLFIFKMFFRSCLCYFCAT